MAALVAAVHEEAPLRLRVASETDGALRLPAKPAAPPRLPPPPGSEAERFENVMRRMEAMVGDGGEPQRAELAQMVEAMRAMGSIGGGGGGGGTFGGVGAGTGIGGGGDVDGDEEASAWRRYEAALASISSQLRAGHAKVSPELYAERDDCLYRLSDAALQQEYVRQSEAYLDVATPAAVRGMAEMLLMKLGELITKPAHARRALGERVRTERLRARATQAAGGGGAGGGGGGSAEDDARNRAAYESLRAKLAAALEGGGESDPELFRRLCNRQELRLVLITQAEASRLGEGEKQAWGTGGLRPAEARAILWAITRVVTVNGKPAAQFKEQLKQKVAEVAETEVVRL